MLWNVVIKLQCCTYCAWCISCVYVFKSNPNMLLMPPCLPWNLRLSSNMPSDPYKVNCTPNLRNWQKVVLTFFRRNSCYTHVLHFLCWRFVFFFALRIFSVLHVYMGPTCYCPSSFGLRVWNTAYLSIIRGSCN